MCSTPKGHRSPSSNRRSSDDSIPMLSAEAMKRFTDNANRAREKKQKDQNQETSE